MVVAAAFIAGGGVASAGPVQATEAAVPSNGQPGSFASETSAGSGTSWTKTGDFAAPGVLEGDHVHLIKPVEPAEIAFDGVQHFYRLSMKGTVIVVDSDRY